jgi:hypothetical protein
MNWCARAALASMFTAACGGHPARPIEIVGSGYRMSAMVIPSWTSRPMERAVLMRLANTGTKRIIVSSSESRPWIDSYVLTSGPTTCSGIVDMLSARPATGSVCHVVGTTILEPGNQLERVELVPDAQCGGAFAVRAYLGVRILLLPSDLTCGPAAFLDTTVPVDL